MRCSRSVVQRVALATVASSLVSLLSADLAAYRIIAATVERVTHGNTVTAITSNQTKLRFRLLGIDAPEIAHGYKPGQPYGEEALSG